MEVFHHPSSDCVSLLAQATAPAQHCPVLRARVMDRCADETDERSVLCGVCLGRASGTDIQRMVWLEGCGVHVHPQCCVFFSGWLEEQCALTTLVRYWRVQAIIGVTANALLRACVAAWAGQWCAICLCRIGARTAEALPCMHVFHTRCIRPERGRRRNRARYFILTRCPICRREI